MNNNTKFIAGALIALSLTSQVSAFAAEPTSPDLATPQTQYTQTHTTHAQYFSANSVNFSNYEKQIRYSFNLFTNPYPSEKDNSVKNPNGISNKGEIKDSLLYNGRTYSPLRFVTESLGCEVSWVQETQTIIIKGPDRLENQVTLTLQIGNQTMKYESPRDSYNITLDATPVLHESTTYVPIRAVAEALGYQVDWTASTTSAHQGQVSIYNISAEALIEYKRDLEEGQANAQAGEDSANDQLEQQQAEQDAMQADKKVMADFLAQKKTEQAAAGITMANLTDKQMEQEMFKLINEARALVGYPAYEYEQIWQEATDLRIDQTIDLGRISHDIYLSNGTRTSFSHSEFEDLLPNYKYLAKTYEMLVQNEIKYTTPARFLEQWLESSSHNRIFLQDDTVRDDGKPVTYHFALSVGRDNSTGMAYACAFQLGVVEEMQYGSNWSTYDGYKLIMEN